MFKHNLAEKMDSFEETINIEAPKKIEEILDKLNKKGYEAYAVGGCVRDLLSGKKPNDWDICTNANPGEIMDIFKNSFCENEFGTVTVVDNKEDDESLRKIEITPFRAESQYSDGRHPDSIEFVKSLKEDLSRRDFTVNAMALKKKGENGFDIIDYFGGQEDLKNRIIRAVGNPEERFNEDKLRLLRAIRFAAVLDFDIEENTKKAIKQNAEKIKSVSAERIRDELGKENGKNGILASEKAAYGFELLKEFDLLQHVLPELMEGLDISQRGHHEYDVLDHNLRALDSAAKHKFPLYLKWAALLHDIAKPRVKREENGQAIFHNHELRGAKMAYAILRRLKYSKELAEKVSHLIKNHMFVYDVGQVTEAGVRRLLYRVGQENIEDLFKLRIADREGSREEIKSEPYKIRHLKYVIEKVSKDPISPKMLAVDGLDVIKILAIKPGPRIGFILKGLLAEILEDPQKNNKDFLLKEIERLNDLSDEELKKMSEIIAEKREEEDTELKNKYWVK